MLCSYESMKMVWNNGDIYKHLSTLKCSDMHRLVVSFKSEWKVHVIIFYEYYTTIKIFLLHFLPKKRLPASYSLYAQQVRCNHIHKKQKSNCTSDIWRNILYRIVLILFHFRFLFFRIRKTLFVKRMVDRFSPLLPVAFGFSSNLAIATSRLSRRLYMKSSGKIRIKIL